MPKSIVYMCNFANTPENGMNYRPYLLGKYAVQQGYDFIVIGAGFHHQMKETKNAGAKPRFETRDGVRFVWLPAKKYDANKYVSRVLNQFLFAWRARRFWRKNTLGIQNPIAVVSSSPSLFSSLAARFWARKLKTKFVFEVRDIWPMSLIELGGVGKWHPFMILLKMVERYSYKKAAKTICTLPDAESYMCQNGLAAGKFAYVPNGVDVEDAEEGEIMNADFARAIRNRFVVGYAGTVGLANNLEILIDTAVALQQQKDVVFAIIGDGPRKTALQQRVLELSLHNVLFVDAVPKTEIQAYIRQFSVGYLGLHKAQVFQYGISPNKLFDYMLASIPVLITVKPNRIVAEAGCGFSVEPDDPNEIAQKILELYQMGSDERVRLGQAGYEYVQKNHTYEHLCKRFISILEEKT